MLSMFGFIKKELKDKGQLIAKYREWKNSLYYGIIEFIESTIPAKTGSYKPYYLFSPNTQDCPVDLSARNWSFIAKVNINSVASNADGNHQLALDIGKVISKTGRGLVRMKIESNFFTLIEYETEPDEPIAVKREQKAKIGVNYLRMDFNASTKAITGYYSYNGTSWVANGSYTVKDPSKMKRIWVWQCHKEATIPVNGIKFIYDGEVLFGK